MLRKLIAFLLMSVLAGVACAGTSDRPEKAKAMVEQAVAYLAAHGEERTLSELNRPDGRFVKGDLYVFAYDMDGVLVAHPHIPALVGKNLLNEPDSTGKLFRKDILRLAKAKGSGWVEYTYANPVTKKLAPKTTYFRRVGNIVLCGGAYK